MKRRSDVSDGSGFTRRAGGRTAGAFLLGPAGLPLARLARAEDGVWVTDVAANAPLPQGVQFVSRSRRAEQNCGNCILFQSQVDGRGRCAILQQGPLPSDAWCVSWGPKPQ